MTREEQIIEIAKEYYNPKNGTPFSLQMRAGFITGAKWADEHPSEQVYTKKQLGEMGFVFTLNGDIVTPNELEEHYRRGIEYRKQKLIEKACKWLENNVENYITQVECDAWIDSELENDFKNYLTEVVVD